MKVLRRSPHPQRKLPWRLRLGEGVHCPGRYRSAGTPKNRPERPKELPAWRCLLCAATRLPPHTLSRTRAAPALSRKSAAYALSWKRPSPDAQPETAPPVRSSAGAAATCGGIPSVALLRTLPTTRALAIACRGHHELVHITIETQHCREDHESIASS